MSDNPKVFVSCSFNDKDQAEVIEPLKELIRACDAEPEVMNDEPADGVLSDAIIERIRKCPLFLAIVTPDPNTGAGIPRPWVIAEITKAMEFDKDVIIFRQKEIPASALAFAAKYAHIEFDRRPNLNQILQMFRRLRKAVTNYRNREQISGDFLLQRNDGGPVNVSILTSQASPQMNGLTFYQGLEILLSQIKSNSNQIKPDLFVGINHTGLMIASYIDGALSGKDSRPLCVVKTGPRTGKKDRKIYYHNIPENCDEFDTVLVTDSQIKRGEAGQQVIRLLKKKFFNKGTLVIFAALVACRVDLQNRRDKNKAIFMEDLFKPPLNLNDEPIQLSHYPDFLAFTSDGDVKPPIGLP